MKRLHNTSTVYFKLYRYWYLFFICPNKILSCSCNSSVGSRVLFMFKKSVKLLAKKSVSRICKKSARKLLSVIKSFKHWLPPRVHLRLFHSFYTQLNFGSTNSSGTRTVVKLADLSYHYRNENLIGNLFSIIKHKIYGRYLPGNRIITIPAVRDSMHFKLFYFSWEKQDIETILKWFKLSPGHPSREEQHNRGTGLAPPSWRSLWRPLFPADPPRSPPTRAAHYGSQSCRVLHLCSGQPDCDAA